MSLPKAETQQVLQVVMTGAFYNAHLKPLLERQDFTLIRMPGTIEEEAADLRTYSIGVGELRAVLAKRLFGLRTSPRPGMS